MFYEILLPLPINKTFSYCQERGNKKSETPPIGTLVEVEFKNKILIGVIIKISDKRYFSKPIKKIRKELSPFILNNEILESIKFISNYSCNKSSMILKLFLSNFPKKLDISFKEDSNVNLKTNKNLVLNSDQILAIKQITNMSFRRFKVILLDGVTGSGKTRVYMQKVKEVINQGFQCLILVPEIILTSQWVDEIKKDFGLRPAVFHSSIGKKEREMIWAQSNCNKVKLVIGTRSALFLPFCNLGLIVVDEEHDSSYKQEEQIIISARDFAIVRAKNSNCMIILSSATPSLETYHNANLNKFKSIKLLKRVKEIKLPKIHMIDMKKESDLISSQLKNQIKDNLETKKQTLIFINKRGYAPLVICKKCGFSKICKNCNTSLVLHNHSKSKEAFLLCHHCNYKEDFSNRCPSCNNTDSFDFTGVGIERISELISKMFPNAKTCILSSDTTRNSSKFTKIVSEIVSNKINIIIGTQLISKGHNFPSLKTVGILNIDNLLNDLDFRSFEKTFQQITQVGGRAGRKDLQGEVFIQTLQPNHPILKLSKLQSNQKFVDWELESRKKNHQPPFVNYISLIYSSINESSLVDFVYDSFKKIKKRFNNIPIYGPAPAILYKKNSKFRYRLLIKLDKKNDIQKTVKEYLIKIETPNNIKLYIDVDPLNFI